MGVQNTMTEYKLLQTQEGSETWDSNGNVTQFDLKCYIIGGDLSKRDAMQVVWDEAPASYEGLSKKSIKFDGYDEDRNAEFTVSYQKETSSGSSQKTDDALEISFSTGGGSKHVVNALAVKSMGDNSYCGNRIGWNGKKGADEEFAGVDIPDSNLQLTLTVTKNMSALNTRWQRNIAELTGKVNDKKFRGYERGEVLFDGCSFSGVEGSEDVKVSYNFSIRLNENNVVIGKGADGKDIKVSKLGFQYVWTVPDFRDDGKNKVNFLKLVRLDTVIPFADFSKLGV